MEGLGMELRRDRHRLAPRLEENSELEEAGIPVLDAGGATEEQE